MNTELRIADAELIALFDAAVDGLIVIDDEGRIKHFNKAAEAMFGYRNEEIDGQPVSILMTDEDASHHELHVRQQLRDGLRTLIGAGREVQARRRTGEVFPAFLAVGEARVQEKTRYVGLTRDLSSEKRHARDAALQHEQLMAVSRLITAGEMAATLAHELNQPLGAIATYTGACVRLLEKTPGDLSRIGETLRQIENQAHRAGETIRRMRQLASRREHRKSDVDIDAVIDEIRLIAERDSESNQVALNVNVERGLPKVKADPQQIQQVLLHLIRNGIESMLAAPPVRRKLDLSVQLHEPLGVRISIADSGHGLSAHDQHRIFDPFFTTKAAGTGMGLPICRSLLEAHGSQLQYTGNEDGGLTFFFNLPASD